MKKYQFLSLALTMFILGCNQSGKSQGSATDEATVRIQSDELSSDDSRSYRNLTVFLIRGKDQVSRNYLSLEEAMENGSIVLHETGSVGELMVDNKSDKHVFIMSGDIVKGGKQDRTIAEDIILKPGSKKVPLKSFCVEHSRWSPRGQESVSQFSSSKKMLSNKNLKIAAREKKEQSAVWSEVAEFQNKTSENIKADVKSRQSATSLQLTLENKDLQATVKEYQEAIVSLFAEKADVLGFAFCVNGKISTVDVFGSAALFSKLLPKLLESAINEAVFQYDEKLKFEHVTAAEVHSFIASAKKGTETTRKTGENTVEKKITTDKSILFYTFDTDAGEQLVHTTIYQVEEKDIAVKNERSNEPQFRHGGFNRNR